jgi:AMP nucleosidase
MVTKEEIVKDWLPRYTGTPLDGFGEYILLVNFHKYLDIFSKENNVPVIGEDKPMQTVTANNITIINFGMGSAMCATIMDLLSAIHLQPMCYLHHIVSIQTERLHMQVLHGIYL